MKLIDCSKYSDGQGAFKNGMHDHIGGLPGTDNLYRQGRWSQFAWKCGWLFQRATGLGYTEIRNHSYALLLGELIGAIRCTDEEKFRLIWDSCCKAVGWQGNPPPRLLDWFICSRNWWRENAKCELKMRHEALARIEVLSKRCKNQRRELAHWHSSYHRMLSEMSDRVVEARNDYKIARHAADEASRQRDEQATLIAQLRAKIARVEALAADSRDARHGPGGAGIYAAQIEEALK